MASKKMIMPRRKGKGAQHPRRERVKKVKAKRPNRKTRNRRLACYCDGWPWSARGGPHRIGSRASSDFTRTTGTSGCRYSKARKVCPDTGAPF